MSFFIALYFHQCSCVEWCTHRSVCSSGECSANEFLILKGKNFPRAVAGELMFRFLKFFPQICSGTRWQWISQKHVTVTSTLKISSRINNELADIVGNFVNRTLAFIEKNFDGKVPLLGALQASMKNDQHVKTNSVKAGDLFEQYRFREGLMEIMNCARAAKNILTIMSPGKHSRPIRTMCYYTAHCNSNCPLACYLLEPVTPATSAKIWKS